MGQLEFDVIGRIKELCAARSWTIYRLAKESGMNHAALNTMMHRTSVPSVPSLIKICNGFGITLAQFFSDEDETAKLSVDERDCLSYWRCLNPHNKELASVYMKGLADGQESNKI